LSSDTVSAFDAAFAASAPEGSWSVESVSGRVPPFVRGTLFMNGPGRFGSGDARYRHWLDGDGMVGSLRIDDDDAHVTARYVRSRKYVEEETARRPIFRTFGTAFPADRLMRGVSLESPVNVSVAWFCGRLLAFGEQGIPWEIDPVTIATTGPFTFGGKLNELSPFSAHPKIDPRTGELFNFGVSFAATQPALHVYRFGADGALTYRRRIPLPYACSIHDFSLGSRHLLFHISPYIVNIDRLVVDAAPLLDALSWEPERQSRLWVVDRESGRLLNEIEVPPRYVLHHAGCAETDGRLELDIVELDEPVYRQYVIDALFSTVAAGRAVRISIDVERGAIVDRLETSYSNAPDFPACDSRGGVASSRLWMLGISGAGHTGRKLFDELVAIDWSAPACWRVYRAPRGCCFAGEPTFVADPENAEGGCVLCPMLDLTGGRTMFGAFDARAIERGPIATLTIPAALPLFFHGIFAPRRSDHA
jgi:all-trans-8'-apo-beta-carotenal 15,15'-oxygenase